MVEADELSVNAILEGVRQGRTVVRITGAAAPMVVLSAREPLVADTVTARRAQLEVVVTDAMGLTLQVFKNGEALGEAVAIDADPFALSLAALAPPEGEDRYRVEVIEARRPVTLTSHVYVRRPAGGGGCGVARLRVGAGGDAGAMPAALLMLLGAAWGLHRRRTRGR
jgi:uncharacterized protein (TIGR03382 family)